MKLRQANFALRVVRRKEGTVGLVYRRTLDRYQRNRLQRVATISPLAYVAGSSMLREAVLAACDTKEPGPGPFYPLDDTWGPRVACYGLVSAGLRHADRLHRAADSLRRADPAEAAWWLGLTGFKGNSRAVRALRILVEAVE